LDRYCVSEILAKAGVKKLLIISQDTSAYWVDLKYQADTWRNKKFKTDLCSLAKGLAELAIWIRLHYPYPHVDDVVPLMAEGKILPYLDVPFQHASRRILKAMQRPANSQNNLDRIHAWRQICPELTIRNTFIVGFPGETEEDFCELLDFLKAARLNKVGCFKYSAVAGAKANELAGALPEEIKEERLQRLMQVQNGISRELLKEKIGTLHTVLVDDKDSESFIAKSMGDAPEIDGNVYLDSNNLLTVGDFASVKIVDADDYDLYGTRG
jgi:ribosomal protein S12 methylthiotransferase